jgi:hypothetical protein
VAERENYRVFSLHYYVLNLVNVSPSQLRLREYVVEP